MTEPTSQPYRASAFADFNPEYAAPGATPERLAHCRSAWQLDLAVRDALPYAWMKTAWDRWAATQTLGDTLEDRYTPFDIRQIKSGVFAGWRTELER